MGCLRVCTLLLLLTQYTFSSIITPPHDGIIVYEHNVDQTGIMPCLIEKPFTAGKVFWSVNGSVVYSGGSGDLRPGKYNVVSDAETTGNFSLIIKDLSRSDSTIYRCQYGNVASLEGRMVVADPPGQPRLSGTENLEENQVTNFTCSSRGGYPAPTFIWSKDDVIVSETRSEPSNNGGVSTSTLETTLSHTDNGKELKCEVSNILMKDFTTRQTLNVTYKPRIKVEIAGKPSMSVVLRDAAFSLTCNVDANPAKLTAVVWKKDGQVLDGESQLTLVEADGVNVDATYACEASNSQGAAQGSLSVTVHYAPVASITQGSEVSVKEGDVLELNCQADAMPSAVSYRWVKDGEVMVRTADLRISAVERGEAGKYTCIASNKPLGEEQSAEESIQVKVQYEPGKPRVVADPQAESNVYTAGGEILFSCVLLAGDKGYPAATYQWFRNDVQLVGATNTLRIPRTTYRDTGSYSCLAFNSVGSQRSMALDVKFHDVPELISTSEPRVNFTKETLLQSIECVFGAVPEPTISWYRNDQLISDDDTTFSFDNSYMKGEGHWNMTSKLLFSGSSRDRVDMYDIGTYECRASSVIGDAADEGSFDIDVHFLPEISGSDRFAGEVGEEVTLACEVLSSPPVTSIEIQRDGKPVTSGDDYQVTDVEYNVDGMEYKQTKSLTILSMKSSDLGTYECEAVNSIGSIKNNMVLQKPSAPETPSQLAVIGKTWGSIKVEWTPGFDGGKAQSFVVLKNGEKLAPVKTPSIQLTNLYPDTEYTITVVATNSLGDSRESDGLTVITESLNLDVPTLTLNNKEKTLTVKMSAPNLCVVLLGTNDGTTYEPLFDGTCYIVDGEKEFELSAPFYTNYAAKSCYAGRNNDVCSAVSEKTEKLVKDDNVKWIVIGAVGGIIAVVLIIAIVAVIIRKRRDSPNKLSKKSISAPIKDGHINHVMVTPSEDVDPDMEQPYATYHPPNNNLNMGTLSTFAQETELQNYDYTYASVQKKSAEQNKSLNDYTNWQHRELERQLSTPPAESNSDNTEQDTLDGDIPEFTHDPDGLSRIIGHTAPQFHRFPNVSESGYSTPDSRTKKVIYEVIV